MKIVLIGKTGSDIPAICTSLKSSGYECQILSPFYALPCKSECEDVVVLYVKISFMQHWESVMGGEYWNENRRQIFEDEIIEFRDADEIADKTFTYNGFDFTELDMEIRGWIMENTEV